VIIRDATSEDWPQIFPIFATIVSEGRTYAYPENLSSGEAQDLWMLKPPGRTVVAAEDDAIVGTATMSPNRPGRGSHIATASFMVDPATRSRGVGRALGEYMLAWATDQGYRGVQFNAVVETNHSGPAVAVTRLRDHRDRSRRLPPCRGRLRGAARDVSIRCVDAYRLNRGEP